MKVFHDPGHGGDDHGCVHNGIVEKDLVLDIALDISEALRPWGITQQFSRVIDVSSSLHWRAESAAEFGADIALVYHIDALEGAPHAKGLITRCIPGDIGFDVAWQITHCAPKWLFRAPAIPGLPGSRLWTKGVEKVLKPYHERNVPAVLIKWGFATNPDDAKVLLSPASRPAIIATAIAGIARAMELKNGNC